MSLQRFSSVVLVLSSLLVACGGPATPTSTKLSVVSTVSPITNIIYNVGGDRISLQGIVPEGVNSHTFEPVPSDAKLLAQADLIFVNGLKLEEPTVKLAEANKQADAEIIQLGEQTLSPDQYLYDFSFPEASGSPNPHLWMNPLNALRYAEIVRDALAQRDAANADYYRANYTAFQARIEQLDQALKQALATIPPENRKLLTYHDSFAYFAPRYGLMVIGAIQPSDFAEPSAQDVAGLISQIRQAKVPAIFGSEVFPSPVLEQIAKETGAKYEASLRDDDLPGQVGEANHSYLGLLVEDVRLITQDLGGDPAALANFDTANVTGLDSGVRQKQ